MSIEQKAQQWLAGLSLQEKVGQLFILAFPGKDAARAAPMVEKYNLGGCYLSQDNADTFAEAQRLTRDLDKMIQARGGLPLLHGVDQEGAWGVLVGESTTGPGNLALGAASDGALTEKMYQLAGEEMRNAGFNCILGPCCDVNFNPLSPIIDTRAFGDSPDEVARHSAAAVKGVHAGNILACAKHFPGHGDTQGDTHRVIPEVNKSLAELRENDLKPFAAAIDAGVDLVMTSHIRYPQLDNEYPATLSPVLLQQVLRDELGFDGIIISDSMNMGAIVHHYSPVDAAVLALKAGITMIMLSEEHYDHSDSYLDKQLAMINGIIDAVNSGELDISVVDDALFRIARFKLEKLAPMTLYQDVDWAANQQQAQDIAQQAVAWVRGKPELGEQLVVVNATPEHAYHNLMNPRGIGPNQDKPGYEYFAGELKEQLEPQQVQFLNPQQLAATELSDRQTLVLVTENFPLPGEDFAQDEAQALVIDMLKLYPNLILMGLRSPYELLKYKQLKHYLCSFSSRPDSAIAAARVLAGKCEGRGGSPVKQVS